MSEVTDTPQTSTHCDSVRHSTDHSGRHTLTLPRPKAPTPKQNKKEYNHDTSALYPSNLRRGAVPEQVELVVVPAAQVLLPMVPAVRPIQSPPLPVTHSAYLAASGPTDTATVFSGLGPEEPGRPQRPRKTRAGTEDVREGQRLGGGTQHSREASKFPGEPTPGEDDGVPGPP